MIRASGMGRIMLCGASLLLSRDYPNDSNDAAKEGTLAHKHSSDMLIGKPVNITDPEMARYVRGYVDLCRSLVPDHAVWGCEEEANDGHLSGHVDFFTWTPYELIVCDLKYGFGWVYPRENWQLISYAVLMWLKHGNNGKVIPPKVRLIVHQPRAGHPAGTTREWSFPGEHLRNYYNQIQNRISEIEAGTATAVPGKHCRYCRAIVDCVANRNYTSQLLDYAYIPERIVMQPVELARELDVINEACDLLKHRLTALTTRVEETIKAGEIVPGYVLSQKTNPLSWDVPDPVKAAADMGVDIAKPVEPLTPTQAVSQGLIDKDIITFMASRKPGGFALKRQSMDLVKELIKGEM